MLLLKILRILVTLIADQPDLGGNYHLGGQVLAPAFKEIVGESLQYMGVASSKQTKTVTKEANKLYCAEFCRCDIRKLPRLQQKRAVCHLRYSVKVLRLWINFRKRVLKSYLHNEYMLRCKLLRKCRCRIWLVDHFEMPLKPAPSLKSIVKPPEKDMFGSICYRGRRGESVTLQLKPLSDKSIDSRSTS